MKTTEVPQRKRKLIPEMEGASARWYARQRGASLDEFRAQAALLTADLPQRADGAHPADVLEVAPGPGYLAIEMARTGRCQVTGLDISRTMVDIARQNAQEAGLDIEFRQGDATRMPFEAESFDLIVCQAAFKNFAQPAAAIAEMYRVLRSPGVAVILDMHHDATADDIAGEVRRMNVSRLNGFTIRATLGMLRRRALSRAQFESLAADSPFGTCATEIRGIEIEVRLGKSGPA
jgi:ubiquinone/menaquinone biosynthesis C-methylase UbiE